MLLGVAPAVAMLSAPCSCPLRDIHERPEEVAFCTAAATCHHLRQVACEVLDLAHAFSSCSRNDVDDRCLVRRDACHRCFLLDRVLVALPITRTFSCSAIIRHLRKS